MSNLPATAAGQAAYPTREYANSIASAQPPAIAAALNSLNSGNERLHDRITVLLQRLDSVLSPLPPAPVGDAGQKLARHSLALQIGAEAAGVSLAAERLDGIINRLEL